MDASGLLWRDARGRFILAGKIREPASIGNETRFPRVPGREITQAGADIAARKEGVVSVRQRPLRRGQSYQRCEPSVVPARPFAQVTHLHRPIDRTLPARRLMIAAALCGERERRTIPACPGSGIVHREAGSVRVYLW